MVQKARQYASRGGYKLESGLRTFKLFSQLLGARALDVGASHGGFTDCLLQHGAKHVTAIDVGHGQLREALRANAKVTLLERTNFKSASLQVAPGPFTFFTVDVSHASARSMLRSLAFRLKEGSHGVVLVKPQFELPKELVRHGVVPTKGLRKLAFNRFKKKARLNGFFVHARADCPVHGPAGNIEILAHLEFRGLAAPGAEPFEQPPVPTLTAVPVPMPTEPGAAETEGR
jgi:23S rRNA (cytidine1920-2'-O)/16S rRNA (cytidine1409-2'-O)-methyltransferase